MLGGTRFMGVATVELLLGNGHEVTIYNRGTRPNPWPGRVRAVRGERADPRALAAYLGASDEALLASGPAGAGSRAASQDVLGHDEREGE